MFESHQNAGEQARSLDVCHARVKTTAIEWQQCSKTILLYCGIVLPLNYFRSFQTQISSLLLQLLCWILHPLKCVDVRRAPFVPYQNNNKTIHRCYYGNAKNQYPATLKYHCLKPCFNCRLYSILQYTKYFPSELLKSHRKILFIIKAGGHKPEWKE